MALDRVEPVRPVAEGFVLDMVSSRTFQKAEFSGTDEGNVRLRAPLTHELAETLPRCAKALAPIAERVAHMLGQAMDGKFVPVTPLTSAKARGAQAVVKARKAEATGRASRGAAKQHLGRTAPLPVYRLKGRVENIEPVLCAITGHDFYNTSPLDLKKVLDDPGQVAGNLRGYVAGRPGPCLPAGGLS